MLLVYCYKFYNLKVPSQSNLYNLHLALKQPTYLV